MEIDLETGNMRQVNNVPLEFPSGIALENNDSLLITERGAGRISRVSIGDGTVVPLNLKPPDALEAPSGIVLQDSRTAIVAAIGTGADGEGGLFKVNLDSGEITLLGKGLDFPSGITLMPDGESLLVVEQSSGVLSKIRISGPLSPTASTLFSREVITIGLHSPQRVAIEPEDNTALVTETNPDGIRRVRIQ